MLRRSLFLLCGGLGCCGLVACKANPPSRIDTATAYWVKHHVTVGGRPEKNPIRPSANNVEAGKRAFGYYCVVCHGRDGQNTGVPFADKMSPPIPSLASPEVQSYTDGQLRWIVHNGIFPSGMPGSKGILDDEDVWRIVLFLRHLPPAGSLGEPKAYSGDEYGQNEVAPEHEAPR